ncbi:MAG: amidohydrolase family protein [Chloroherpetonaceae bacterium]|nr:amidohydrolase family protein [Chloroherpetonaceae bacterium]MDW8436952.1 amidohydrolase family protein [Chloroherpetonaceae bacterium]
MRSLLIHNARIFGKPDRSAALCENGVFKAFLRESDAENLDCEGRLDAQGNLLLPSFFDSHIHLSEYGLRLNRLNLNGKTLDESLALIRQKVDQTPKGEWISGGGWHKTYFKDFPTRKLLDAISTEHFIALSSQDFHAVWANSPALDLLDPNAFKIEELPRDETDKPLGLALERAALKLASLATPSTTELANAIGLAQERLLSFGVTDAFSIERADALAAFAALGDALKLRLHLAIYLDSLSDAREFFRTHRVKNLSLNAVKLFIDGSLGAETCAVLEPFENSRNFGIDLYADSDLVQIFKMIEREGFNVAVHAIGDRAVRRALNAFESIGASPRSRFRHRIEHAQMIHPDDLPRFAKLGVVASMQPVHIREDIATARRLLGARQSELYRFKSLLESGATVVFGSDAPIETPNVAEGLYYAVERRDKEGNSWFENERVSFEEALRAYSETPNVLMNESQKGKLDVGCAANAVIVPRDFARDSNALLSRQSVLATIVAGEVLFESGELPPCQRSNALR